MVVTTTTIAIMTVERCTHCVLLLAPPSHLAGGYWWLLVVDGSCVQASSTRASARSWRSPGASASGSSSMTR